MAEHILELMCCYSDTPGHSHWKLGPRVHGSGDSLLRVSRFGNIFNLAEKLLAEVPDLVSLITNIHARQGDEKPGETHHEEEITSTQPFDSSPR